MPLSNRSGIVASAKSSQEGPPRFTTLCLRLKGDRMNSTIVLCLRCHAEAGHNSYNSQHPIGNKYSPAELRQRRDNWWKWCAENPATIPPKSPIMITPTSVALIPGEWARTTIVVIHNRSDRPLFQIWVKASVSEPISFGRDLDVTPFVGPDALSLSCADFSVSGGVLGWMGEDASGNPAQLWRFYGLDSGKTCRLNIVDRCKPAPDRCSRELMLGIVEFSEAPPPLLERHDGSSLAMPFHLPEDGFTIRATWLHAVQMRGSQGA